MAHFDCIWNNQKGNTHVKQESKSIFQTDKRIRLGICGLGRGQHFLKTCAALNMDVVAGCDQNNTPFVDEDDPLGLGLAQAQGENFNLPAKRTHTHAALFASRHIVQWAQQLAQERGQKLMLVVSHGQGYVENALEGNARWDQSFLDHLATQPVPVVDLTDAYAQAFQTFRGSPTEFLAPYFNGHHSPAGNYFFAEALRKPFIDWLTPKPPSFRDLQSSRGYFPDEKRS